MLIPHKHHRITSPTPNLRCLIIITYIFALIFAKKVIFKMSSHIKIGVFIPNGAQFLDVACVDSFGVMSKAYLGAIPFLPAHVTSLAPDVAIYYISTPEQGSEIPLTSGATIKATHLYTDDEVAPGQLDIVVVPGPDPGLEFAEGGLKWLREQSEAKGVDVLSICTGLFICASAGIADGKRASGPRGLQSMLKDKFPRVNLVGDKYRWVQDGNFWSSGMFAISIVVWCVNATGIRNANLLAIRWRHEWK